MYSRLAIKKGIISTLCYADVFDYPLSLAEIHKYFIGEKKINLSPIKKELNALVAAKIIGRKGGHYYLKDRESLPPLRKRRYISSKKKIKLAVKSAKLLNFIPTIKFIGISGSLSMHNAKESDDIDLFFITQKNTLWISRFFVNFILSVMRYKRAKKDKTGADKICPNMFLAEDNLRIPHLRQNLYSAHEVAQILPLIDKDSMFRQFLSENLWVLSYLPNFTELKIKHSRKEHKQDFKLGFINELFYLVQYVYMMKRITNEEVNLKMARFHPRDMSAYVIDLFEIRLKNFMFLYKNELSNTISNAVYDTPGY